MKHCSNYDSDSDCDEQLTSNCAIHNLEAFCSSSSGGTSTFCGGDDNGSVCDLDCTWDGSSSDDDGDDDDEASTSSSSSSVEGKAWKNWTMSKILGHPTWLNKFKVKKFDTLEQFEQFKCESESAVHEILCRHAYNTIGSFNQFYEDYRSADKDEHFDFDEFFFDYKAKLKPDSLSCVGLSIRLLELFKERFGPTITDHCGMVSCEEIVKDPNKYNMHTPNTAKEHCLSALKLSISDQNGKWKIKK